MEISPDWVVGFVDGEGCFYVGFTDHPEMTTGYQVLPEFRVVQHKRDIQVLYGLKKFFRHGVVRQNHDDRWELRIRKFEGLKQVVTFFEKHSLKTKKGVDFKKFARIIHWMEQRKHLTDKGLLDMVILVKGMNTMKSDKLIEVEKKLNVRLKQLNNEAMRQRNN